MTASTYAENVASSYWNTVLSGIPQDEDALSRWTRGVQVKAVNLLRTTLGSSLTDPLDESGQARVPIYYAYTEVDTTDVRYYLLSTTSGSVVLIDGPFGGYSRAGEYRREYLEVVGQLREVGREIVASQLKEILEASLEDPEEPEVRLFSLRSMAHFLTLDSNFKDPILGPDSHGIMQLEWYIDGNGLLVMAFLEDNEVHFIVQADETPDRGSLDYNIQKPMDFIVEEYSHLVPVR